MVTKAHVSPHLSQRNLLLKQLLVAHKLLWGDSFNRIEWLGNGSAAAPFPAGSFVLLYDGLATPPIAFNAPAGAVKAARSVESKNRKADSSAPRKMGSV